MNPILSYILWNWRLSRIFGTAAGLLAVVIFSYGCVAPNSFLIGTGLAIGFGSMSVGFFLLGNWWEARELRRQAGEDLSLLPRRRGFDAVVPSGNGKIHR